MDPHRRDRPDADQHGSHKLLVANRGEIAVRILRTAKKLGLKTVSIYTRPDAASPHVSSADKAVELRRQDADPLSNSQGYLDADAIADVCATHGVTLVHPGYGFLAETASFPTLLASRNITWLGPHHGVVEAMGLKHVARKIATELGIPVVPGSSQLLSDAKAAQEVASEVGYPVMLKSTSEGGGIGLLVCKNEQELIEKFDPAHARAAGLCQDGGVFIERYLPNVKHVEIQIFANGLGHVVHLGDRECSIQRRHQKVIEESPSPCLARRPEMRKMMQDLCIKLCSHIRYSSAGTIEFLVDETSDKFYFLEMNTRLQVEHTVTEAVYRGLDIVELMIRQGIEQSKGEGCGLSPDALQQSTYESTGLHAIQARIYCENPSANFRPAPGLLQDVHFPSEPGFEWLRVDTWVETGTRITPYFDPLIAKVIAYGSSREEANARLLRALQATRIRGPPTNLEFLRSILQEERWKAGHATTTFLKDFRFTPRAMDVLSGGIDTTVQDHPGRKLGIGMPRSGPMDFLAHRAANALVGNPGGMETLEMVLIGGRFHFHVPAIVAITGAPTKVTVDGQTVEMWTRLRLPAGARLSVGTMDGRGFRAYLAVQGGFPGVPEYLGSKSTSMGLGGYQGRALIEGDQLALSEDCGDEPSVGVASLLAASIPQYPEDWTLHCLAGPHCDEEFVTATGISEFFNTKWTVNSESNRMGINLQGKALEWARKTGGEGGSHPSNIHDNGYALGTVNLNGDFPVILANEGPDMGGFACFCTVASADRWKLGQLRPGDTVQFKRISQNNAVDLLRANNGSVSEVVLNRNAVLSECAQDPKLHVSPADSDSGRPRAIFRQAGDSAILVEFGDWVLDFELRARVHAFEQELARMGVPGVWAMAPCIRSTMIHYDPLVIAQSDLLTALVAAEQAIPPTMSNTCFPGRRITFPITVDDKWCKAATEKYMREVRDKAVYLPSNVEYLARNNAVEGGVEEALERLVSTDWLVFGVGFYLACPFLVATDPRCRLTGQKFNPPRTWTPRGAVGLAGLVAAIYPVESPGGYQLFGRTLSPWSTWGRGRDFAPDRPWLLKPFDQVRFQVVGEDEYEELERKLDAGQYGFEIEDATFSMAEYNAMVESVKDEVEGKRQVQELARAREEASEKELLEQWQSKAQTGADADSGGAWRAADLLGEGEYAVKSSIMAAIATVQCRPGDVIHSPDQVLVVMEALKTEVLITAGEEYVGLRVKALGSNVRERAMIGAGETLVVLEDV